MEAIIRRQSEIFAEIKRIHSNFKKDSGDRKTAAYIQVRLVRLDELWQECITNDNNLMKEEEKEHQYFKENIMGVIRGWYEGARNEMAAWQAKHMERESGVKLSDSTGQTDIKFDSTNFELSHSRNKMNELIQLQNANFRALMRLINIQIDDIAEKWEIEDKLKRLESRWLAIDQLHLQIDGLLEGAENDYYIEFSSYESHYEKLKKKLNNLLNTTLHQQHATPKIDIPTFSGSYTQWPTFMDLYMETIHNNSSLSKTQKMQHLKGRLRGEAEKLVQHLHIAPENYDTCWELLNHRYHNKYLLFTKNFQIFMRQPNIQKQSAFELKRMYDTSNETINAIYNLGIDTSTWDPALVYILCEKLDSETYTEYMQFRPEPREIPTLDNFMSFIENKFMALEPLQRKKIEPVAKSQSKTQFNNVSYSYNKKPTPSYQPSATSQVHKFRNFRAYNVNQFNKLICPLCNCNHALFQCTKFIDMANADKLKFITKNNICRNCLYLHTKGYCASQKRCKECDETHNTLLHNAISTSNQPTLTTRAQQSPMPVVTQSSANQKNMQNNFVSNNDDEILLPTALMQVATAYGNYITLRALIDQGSQITLITENAAQKLGLQRQQLNASIKGIGTLSNKSKGKVALFCKSLHSDFQFTTEALVMTRVVNNLPNTTFAKKPWNHVTNIVLADPHYNISQPIDILLDAHVYSQILMNGLIKGEDQQPMAQQTQLGWILSGNTKTYNCNVVINNVEDLTKYWEIEDINDNACNILTPEERYCEEFFIKTTKRLKDGRYEVRIPMKPNFSQLLGKSKPSALAQFMQLERRLERDKNLSFSYIKFMQEYLQMSHMKESRGENIPSCYLPHHGVLKQESVTTKLRVVFNASQKTDTGYSLNDLMECGPKLHQDLMTLLLGWRLYKYVFTADCEKMYRQILVNEKDQHLQKIIWRESNQSPLKEYQLTTVTYGTKAAPFLALRTLQQLANDDAYKYPLAANIIKNEMYVDDVISGNNCIKRAQEIQHQLIDMLAGAGFTLRKWTSNEPSLIKNLSSLELNQTTMHFTNDGTTKTLGLQWNPKTDNFTFTNKINANIIDTLTKRKILSEISKIFDPLGWLTPLTVKAKLLFQKIWVSGCNWDETLSNDIQHEWKVFTSDLNNIVQISIPRWLGDTGKPIQIHGFCDASEKVYACVIYLHTLNDRKEPVIRLIAAKSKLSPISKKLTLPRLELCGAVLLARLMKKVLTTFKWDKIDTIYAWTDSMIVLGWLRGDMTKWKSFVSNRIRQINDVIPKQHWYYVKSEENAADCATRGTSCSQLLQHPLWWQGPDWLKDCKEKTSEKIVIIPTTCESKHKQIKTCVVQSEPSSIVIELLDLHSNMTHITRIVAWIKRFTNNSTSAKTRTSSHLTSNELKSAEKLIIKQIQLHAFRNEIMKLKENHNISSKSKILALNPYLDKDDILRVGGRLRFSNLSTDTKHPMLLPHDHKLTDLLIWQAHYKTLHGGPKLTLTHLRQKFWIVGGYRVVKKVLHKCIICRRFNAKTKSQIMSDLPEPRVSVSRPFSHTGVDFTGYVEIKANKGRGVKTLLAYIAVFVCLATKAVHLELVSELSSIAFLAAFKRFCARRGTPRDMYSDNGTNFIGANRILLQQYQSIIKTIDSYCLNKVAEMGINWHFNAPLWPSAGGLWEAAVKSMKYHLKRVIGEQRLTYEEFSTLLCQIEACLNSRPLCTVTENAEEIDCLTPSHFLTGTALATVPEPDIDINYDLRKRWQVVQRMGKDFWKRWSQEYLQQLQARLKWKQRSTNPQENDIVCIKDENLPAGRWALGRIVELHPGKDGNTRVVTLQTAKGKIKRPVIKLVPLLQAENKADMQRLTTEQCNRTRKKMSWKNIICSSLLLVMTLITPAVQQDIHKKEINITPFTQNQTLYFDKLSDMQEIKDEWKLIFYYNMTNYWRNVDALQQYIDHIKQFRKDDWAMQFHVLISQLEQSTNEIMYYNELLKSQHLIQHRLKRGIIDGVGYLANTLFGVLDQRFADKYEHDIRTIQSNSQHLLQLIQNQTSILETEQNILQRNEATMIKHFNLINDHLNSLENDTLKQKIDTENAFYVITSAIAAESVVQNLKYIQHTLINTLTNMYRGHIDVHLLSVDQLHNELNKIARHLPRDLALPETLNDVRDMYRLFRIHARLTQHYLIMEIKVPLLGDELYELNKVISIPQRVNATRVTYVIPASDLIAFNIKQYSFIPLDQTDVHECQKVHEQKLICKINHPVYITGSPGKSICDIKMTRNNIQHNAYCHIETQECADKWIQLHKQNTWLYYCCDVCLVHIICPAGMTSETLRHTGLITLRRGCVLKGDTFMIHANIEHTSDVFINEFNAMLPIPSISPINNIINTSIKKSSLHLETHEEKLEKIKTELHAIKEQSTIDTLTTHDIHHYVMIYVILTLGIALLAIFIYYWWRKTRRVEDPRVGRGSHEEDVNHEYTEVQKPKSTRVKHTCNTDRVQFDTETHSEGC